MMYFSRVYPSEKPDRLADGYRVHQLIWKLFGDHRERTRDFLFRIDMIQGRPRIYALSARQPQPYGNWQIDSKSFQPKFQTGTRLTFNLRVNPVVSKPGHKRHDVVMNRKTQLKDEAGEGQSWQDFATMDQIVRQEGLAWLQKRSGKNGFSFQDNNVRVEAYQQHQYYKKGKPPRKFSTLDFNGLITVEEPNAFVRIVEQGIGPAKSFGCGLFLLRRAP